MAQQTVNASTASPSRRGRWLFWPGVILVVAGLALLGYVAWQLWGTNYVSQQRQEQAVTEISEAWQQGDSVVATDWGEAEAIIRIPRFGDDYAIPVFEGTGDEVLSAGYGHFADTAEPGQIGNYALAAHRVTHGEPLRDMPELDVGDQVIVETRQTTYTYELVSGGDDLIVDFHDIWVTDPLPTNPEGGVQPPQKKNQRLLTLTTCSELFHTDNRMIAFATLVDTARRS
ncbi:class E sortase [Nocardioides insulae]|uniref:class E sortase n=1 Tax=Nocardioides insulae TaxID=394734 RepID=UPI000406AD40|nr:class E sortase [Nocardioides insulae]